MDEIREKVEALADDAGTLRDSTVGAAGQRYGEARDALGAALKRGKSIYGDVRRRAVKDTKQVDRAIHGHLYQAIAIGIGLGVVLGYALSRKAD